MIYDELEKTIVLLLNRYGEIGGCDGKKLVKFELQESYAAAAGLRGANYLDIEDLMERF